MPESDIVRRLRLSLKSAQYALTDEELEAGLLAAGRLVANNFRPLVAELAPITIAKVDNTELNALTSEKYSLIAERSILQRRLAQAEADMTKMKAELTGAKGDLSSSVKEFVRQYSQLSQLMEYVLTHWQFGVNSPPDNKMQHKTSDPSSQPDIPPTEPANPPTPHPLPSQPFGLTSVTLRFPLKRLRETQNTPLAEIESRLDKILASFRHEPSPELAAALKIPDLADVFPNLAANIQEEAKLCNLPPYVYMDCRKLFGDISAGGHSKNHASIIFLAMVNNLPFDLAIDNRRYERLRTKVGRDWCNKPSEAWAACAICSGNLQKNLHRLREVGWR